MAFSFSPKVVTNGLVLALDAANPRSYPGNGTTWSDLTPNINNGSLVNGPTFSSDSNGGITFDGTNDYYAVNYPSSFSDHTIIVVAKITNLEKDWIPIMEFSSSIFSQQYAAHYYVIGNTNTQFPSTKNSFAANWQTTVSQATWSSASLVTVSANQTYMFTGRARNGVGDTFQNLSKTKDSINITYNNIPLTQIKNFRQFTGQNFYFGGIQYLVLVYDRGISDAEIVQNYNALKGRFNLT